MHDIDRTQMEMEWELGDDEYEFEEEYEDEGEYEYEDEGEFEFEFEGPFDEAEEMELAAELLEVADDDELEYFLGKLFKKVSRRARKAFRSPAFRALGGSLKGLAKKALPVVGGALGSIVAPGAGTAVGSALGSAAGRIFGLELEGLSPEDQEFEVARRFVRLAGDAAKVVAKASPSVPAKQVAKAAVAAAVRKHAPGLTVKSRRPGRHGRRGMWIRRGRTIILQGV